MVSLTQNCRIVNSANTDLFSHMKILYTQLFPKCHKNEIKIDNILPQFIYTSTLFPAMSIRSWLSLIQSKIHTIHCN